MSDKFRIHKTDSPYLPWALDYPHGFRDDGCIGEACSTFDFARQTFITRSEQRCPICLRGAVVDTDYGWKCENCGTHDVASGCTDPTDGKAAR